MIAIHSFSSMKLFIINRLLDQRELGSEVKVIALGISSSFLGELKYLTIEWIPSGKLLHRERVRPETNY